MSIWDIALLGAVGAALYFALRAIVRGQKRGGCTGCSGGCRSCARYSACGGVVTRRETPSK